MRHIHYLALALAVLGMPLHNSVSAQRDTASGFVPLDSTRALAGGLATLISLDIVDQPVSVALATIARQARLSFVADRALPGMTRPVQLRVKSVPAATAIMRALSGSGLRAMVGPGGQIVIVAAPAPPPRDATTLETTTVRLTGFVRSAASNEVIRHAMLIVDENALTRQSNEEGFYVLTVPSGVHRLRVRAIGFAPLDTTVTLESSRSGDLFMRVFQVTLATMQVQGDRHGDRPDLDPLMPDMSVVRLDLATVRKTPPLLGEVDPIRSLTLLPGVATTNDASTAFSVRGGGVDQNLILLDESTIYNPSHILGFISTFNADAVDDVTLYKGAIPARFGGRTSSVVDVRQREGNANQRAASVSIGLLSSRATVEGPLFGKRGSYMVAGRRSYADMFLGLASDSALAQSSAYFYDINAKSNVRLGERGALMLSGYLGRDVFSRPTESFGVGWGNRAATLRWNQAIGDRLFSKVAANWSDYDYRLQFSFERRDSAEWKAGILTGSFKVDETLQLTARHRLEFGGEVSADRFNPGALRPVGDSSVLNTRAVEARRGRAAALYLGHEFEAGPLAVRYGMRYAVFNRVGLGTRYRYRDDAPIVFNDVLGRYESGTVLDSQTVKAGSSLVSYDAWEPRASARWSLTNNSSLKASYSRTQQFLHLVSNTNSPSPLDVWEPVGPFVRPLVADQYAIGASQRRGNYELTAETYVKQIRNVVDFIDGADVVLNPRMETILVQGSGRAYGLELYARRTTGRLTGWTSYTLARAEQRFPVPHTAGASAGGGVNDGQWYVSPYDKTHNLTMVAVWQWTPQWTIGSTFVVASGLPTTLPTSRYVIDDLLVTEYGARNSARLPLYHRLDVSMTRTMRRGELQFGVMNAYNHFNAQSLRVRAKESEPLVAEAVQTSIFGIVPSINYVFRFKD